MGFEERFDVTEDEYMEMIFKKTGALIAAATKAGAIMGGADDEVIDSMYEYGRLIGLAFQIQDDYLDLASDEETLGKPIGSDIGKGKMTIIAIKGLESVDDDRLLEILKAENNSQDEIDEAIEILTNCGAIEYARNLALESVDKAKQVLEILDDSSSKQVLSDIADFVLERSA
jgi:geranylgeranyl diphosphate synthase type I